VGGQPVYYYKKARKRKFTRTKEVLVGRKIKGKKKNNIKRLKVEDFTSLIFNEIICDKPLNMKRGGYSYGRK
jgi:hypothetical protein